jgi:NAD(P)-dependent dehydrogenase (short-subunit alcohol dehydrogenase family)
MAIVSVVSGGASGMGRASAKLLGKDNPVLIFDINEPLLKEAVEEFKAAGIDAHSMVCDITIPGQVDDLVKYATSLGEVKSVVHAAAWDFNTVDAMPEPEASAALVENVMFGTMNMVNAFYPVLRDAAFVSFASLAGYMYKASETDFDLWEEANEAGFFDKVMHVVKSFEPALGMPQHAYVTYCYAKCFCHFYVRANAVRYAENGCNIIAVSPGSFDTPILAPQKALNDGQGAENLASCTAVGRIGRPGEMGELVYRLCDPALRYMTGVDVLMDGGVNAFTTTCQID